VPKDLGVISPKIHMSGILIIGSSNTDMVIKTDQLPLPGETVLGGNFFMNAGGKGANQAVAAARLGGQVTLLTKLGDDIFGKQALDGFIKENINTQHIFFDKQSPSGTALIMVNNEGENCIAVAPGANAKLLPADIDYAEQINEADIILMQLEIPLETVSYVAKKAKTLQRKLIINPAPAQKLSDEILDGLFLITPNETEAFVLTGIKVTDENSAFEAADIFIKKGVQHVVVTMGSRGAVFEDRHQKFSIPAPVVKALDTTAAGDVFNGALAVSMTEDMDWKQALAFAVKAASISVTRMGAQSSAPYRKEIF
jgi:ribokinase